jgi:hypothetical protein
MANARRLAGLLMVLSAFTHLSELFVFDWSRVMAFVVGFGLAFFAIGLFLLRPGRTVLWWGAIVPSVAVVLGTANSLQKGSFHPHTIWHLAIDLVVIPICVSLLWQGRGRAGSAPR